MMPRTVIPSIILVILAGCQSAYRSPAAAPPRLDERLAAIERHRTASDTTRGSVTPGSPLMSADTRTASANRPARLKQRAWPDVAQTWALTDMGEMFADEEPQPGRFISANESSGAQDRRSPLDSFWETVKRDVRHMPGDLWQDTCRVYSNPTNLVILGTAYGTSLALQQMGPDHSVEHHFAGGHNHLPGGWNDALGAVGNPGTHFGLAGLWYLIGQQTDNEKTYEVGKTLFSALIINNLTTMVGQAASWDRGPNGEWGTLPSGHTSSSFTMASVLHQAYGHAVGIPLYGLAAMVAMERIDDDEHYLSDVVMGAVLGTVIGHSVASGRDPEFFGWKVLPYANPNGATGVAFMKSLP